MHFFLLSELAALPLEDAQTTVLHAFAVGANVVLVTFDQKNHRNVNEEHQATDLVVEQEEGNLEEVVRVEQGLTFVGLIIFHFLNENTATVDFHDLKSKV